MGSRSAQPLFRLLSILVLTASSLPAGAQQAQRPSGTAKTAGRAPVAFSGFTVSIALSPRAAARMAKRDRTLVSVTYRGTALPAFERRAEQFSDELGVDLGNAEIMGADRAGTVSIGPATLNSTRLSWVDPRSVEVSVTVLSARRSSPDNLLVCQPSVTMRLQAINGRTVNVACKLIGER